MTGPPGASGRSWRRTAAWLVLPGAGLAAAALSAGIGGPAGLLYLAIYVLATVPGWPLGFALFGRRHAAGWIAGALLGYAVTALAIWCASQIGWHSGVELAAVWLVVAASAWLPYWLVAPAPMAALPRWMRRDSAALGLVFALVLLLCSQPFLKVGARDPDGTRAYRAYFTMDFFWHTALTAEVSKFTTPPRNPFWASEPLHYYWTYFLLPAAVVANAPAGVEIEIEPTLLVNAMCTGLALIGMVFILAWIMAPRAGPVALAVALILLAASAEGSYALLDLLRRGRPLDGVRELNIDAVTAWPPFGGLRVDGLPRSLWWVPQHATSGALGLVALALIAGAGASASLGAIALAGCALGAAITMSPFLGAAFSLVYGAAVLVDALREPRRAVRQTLRHLVAAVPVAAALGWCAATGVLEGTSGAMRIGFGGLAAHAPLVVLALSFGPVLVPAAIGLWPCARVPDRAAPALAGLVVGLGLLYFVRIPLDAAYVGFRAGQVVLMTLPGLVALAAIRIWDHHRMRAVGGVLLAVLGVIGLPTTAIDWYNAQDTSNRRMGPGFSWTQTVTPEEQDAFRWIRRATPIRATVQMDPVSRGRDSWTMIPTFGHRRMAAGMAYSLLQVPQFEERSNRARTMYETPDADQAWTIARDLGVDYIYMDRTERGAFPASALDKFDEHPDHFRRVFANAEVRIYSVVPHAR